MKTKENHLKNDGHPKRVLALDGGGVRGMITLGVLSTLEKELRRRSGLQDYRLCEYFDFVGGTSTGSIIASALALGDEVDTIIKLYREMIPQIFAKPSGGFRIPGVTHSLYKADALSEGLRNHFGNMTLGSPKLRTGLAIHCKRMDSGSAWVLVNNPDWTFYGKEDSDQEWIENRKFRLRNLIQASTAAPHYFNGVRIQLSDGEGDNDEWAHMVDGGVSANNNPALEILTTLRDQAYGFEWDLGHKNLMMTSIGTGSMRLRFKQGEFEKLPYVMKTINSLKSMMNDVALQQLVTLQALSLTRVRWFINGEKLDQPTAPYFLMDKSKPLMDFQRIDVRIDQRQNNDGNFIGDLLGRDISEDELEDLQEMACAKASNLDMLYASGEASGQRFIGPAYPPAHFDPPQWRVGPGPEPDPMV